MKFIKLGRNVTLAGRATLATALSLGLISTFACSRDYTAAYVYAPSSQTGNIAAFGVDFQSGIIEQISGSPFPSQLTNPTTAIASPDGKFLYVVGGSQNAQVESFAIGTDGKLYGQVTRNITGTYPTAAAIDSTGTYLYVTYRYQNGFGPSSIGPGGVTVFTIDRNSSSTTFGQLGATPQNVNVDKTPVGVSVTVPITSTTPANQVFAYVIEQPLSTATGTVAGMLEFSENTSNGSLTQLGTIASGVTPTAVNSDPTGRFVYVTDATSNLIYGYAILSSGIVQAIPSSPFTTGLYPVAISIDPRGKFLYVANYNANTVGGYTLNHADGSLGGGASGSFSTATTPNCITIEPALGIYLYTSNYQDGSISGAQLSPNTGGLSAIANTQFPTVTFPSCVTSVANGSHANSIVNPN